MITVNGVKFVTSAMMADVSDEWSAADALMGNAALVGLVLADDDNGFIGGRLVTYTEESILAGDDPLGDGGYYD